MHLASAVHVYTHDLVMIVNTQSRRVGRTREVELAEGFVFQQEADDVAVYAPPAFSPRFGDSIYEKLS